MPTEQPSSAPEGIEDDARDAASVGAVLHDDAADQPAGGGGLRGPAAADPLAGRTPTGTSRNSPIDTKVVPPGEDGAASAEARAQAVADDAREPHPGSQ